MTEIHIQLAGVKLGPYSEKQVRQYLTEGLLSASDPARLEGSDQWIPVTELLANLPPPAPEPPPEEPATPPEPVEPKATEAKEAPAVEPKPEMKAAETPASTEPAPKPEPVSKVDPTPAPTPGSKAPPASPGFTGLPERITSGPLPIPYSAVTAPKRPETKRVAMSQVVRSLAQRNVPEPTKLPSHSPEGPSITSLMRPASAPVTESKLPKEKRAEPVETRALPPVKAAGKGVQAPSTQPVASAKMEQMTGTALPSMVRALAKKPAPEAPTGKSTQLAALSQSQKTAEPALAKIAELKPEPQQTESTPPPSEPSAQPAPPQAVPVPEPAPASEAEKPSAKPATKQGPIRILIYAAVGVVLLCILYIGSAYHAASAFWQALNTGDTVQLESAIDFPAVRDSLKEEMKLQVARSPGPASDAVRTMIDNSIDHYVTSQGISALASKAPATVLPGQGQTISTDVATSILLNLNYPKVNSQGLVTPNDFVVDTDLARFHFHFYGLGWKLNRVELKSAVQLPTVAKVPAAAPTPTPAPASPLTSSVVETYLASGNEKCQKGDWDGAISDFTQVLNIDPKATVAYNNRGYARQSKNDLDGAIADYTQAITLDPKLSSAYFSRGNAKLAKNDYDGAIADYTLAVGINPKLAEAYYFRGNAKTGKNDLDGAIADYTQALTLDPNQANAYSNRGVDKRIKNDLDGAINDFTQALAINPKLPEAYFNRGLTHQAQGNDEAAILDFNQAIDLDPKMARAYYNRGNAKNAKGDSAGAIGDYTQAITLDPKNAMAFCYRGVARQAKSDFDGAIADYTQALSLDSRIPIAYYNRALIEEQKDDPDAAIADSTHALDLDPKNPQAYYNRGFATLTKGNLAGASADLQKFCELAPRDHFADHARLYLWLIGKAQSLNVDVDQALSSSLVSDWNSTPDDLVTKIAGFLLDRVTETDLIASAISSDAVKDQGQHCEVWYFAGMKRLLAGDKDTAIAYFHKSIATEQKDYCEYILAQAELRALESAPKN